MKSMTWPTIAATVLAILFLALTASAQDVILRASDRAETDHFGINVAIDGDLAVVGAPDEDEVGAEAGAVFVYRLTDGTWAEEAKLTADDGYSGQRLGRFVAVSGDAIVAGTGAEGGTDAVYVFRRSGGAWTQEQKLSASDGVTGDGFAQRVAMDGDTIVVPAWSATVNGSACGAAYVFVRSGGTWTEQQKIVPGDPAATDTFGRSVALHEDTVILGTNSEAAYVFFRSGGTWSEQAKLTPSTGSGADRFGWFVDVEGDLAVVGAHLDSSVATYAGAAYVYSRGGSTWSEVQRVTASDGGSFDYFGAAVAVSGRAVLVGANGEDKSGSEYDAGAAYLFLPAAGTWTERRKCVLPERWANDNFGVSVALSGNHAIVGAYRDNDGVVDAGTATIIPVDQRISPADAAADDRFGYAVSIAGDTAIVGATGVDSTGAAYVYRRSGHQWIEEATLVPAGAEPGDNVGASVAIDGDVAVVGAPQHSVAGAAYIFTREAGTWTETEAIVSTVLYAPFGYCVAVSGDTVVVGALQRSVEVYRKLGGTWSLEQTIDLPRGSPAQFGRSVAIFGDTLLVGSARDGESGWAGAAYVFVRANGVWTEQARLTCSGATADDNLGMACSLGDDLAVVGASGKAIVYARENGVWKEVKELTPSDSPTGSLTFGRTVGMSGHSVVVGDRYSGKAYLYTLEGGTWGERRMLTAVNPTHPAYLGSSVAICGNVALVGTHYASEAGSGSGVVLSYREVGAPIPTLEIQSVSFPESTTGLSFHAQLAREGGLRPPFTWVAEGDFPITGGIDPFSGAVSGDYDVPGDYSFTIRVTDGCGLTAERSFWTRVNERPVLDTTSLPRGVSGRPYSVTLTAHGGTGNRGFWQRTGDLPAGLSLNETTGVISGTPTGTGRFIAGCEAIDSRGAHSETRGLEIHVMPVADLTARKLREDPSLADGLCHRALELLKGTMLTVKVKYPKGSTDSAELTLTGPDGAAVSFGDRLVTKSKSIALKNLLIPATGRYCLTICSKNGFSGALRLDIKVKAPKKGVGEVRVPQGGSVTLELAALPGATLKLLAKASRGSNALPQIVSVRDGDGTELLVPEDLKVKGGKATLKISAPVGGGKIVVTVATRDDTAGAVTVKGVVKQPKTYEYKRPTDPMVFE